MSESNIPALKSIRVIGPGLPVFTHRTAGLELLLRPGRTSTIIMTAQVPRRRDKAAYPDDTDGMKFTRARSLEICGSDVDNTVAGIRATDDLAVISGLLSKYIDLYRKQVIEW